MSTVTYHACDVCGSRLDKGDSFTGVVLRSEKVDQGFWCSEQQRTGELCPKCVSKTTVGDLIARLFPQPTQPESSTSEDP